MRALLLILAGALGVNGAAQAASVSFLGKAPIAYMTDEDKRLFQAAVAKALDDTADGDTVTWSNPATKAGGEIKLVRTEDADAMLCRIAQVHSRAGGRENRGVYRACKEADGPWRLAAVAGAPRNPESKPDEAAE